MLGTQLEQFSAPQEEAMLLMERVLEAQRHAAMELRGKVEKRREKGGRRGRGGGDEGGDADADPELQRMMKQKQQGKKRRR